MGEHGGETYFEYLELPLCVNGAVLPDFLKSFESSLGFCYAAGVFCVSYSMVCDLRFDFDRGWLASCWVCGIMQWVDVDWL